MSEDYFRQGGGIELKLGRMIYDIWSYHCMYGHVCAFAWVSVHKACVMGTSVWALFYWKCHAFIGTGVLFFCTGVL